MIAYRLARRKYADLSGEGARLYGGRYNPPGFPAIYAAGSIALAVLEVLVHLDKWEIPDDYVALAIQFSGRRVRTVSAARMQRLRAVTADVHNAGAFQREFHHPVLRVPSVIIPREHNYVLFPAASGFDARILWREPFRFDQRLFAMAAEA